MKKFLLIITLFTGLSIVSDAQLRNNLNGGSSNGGQGQGEKVEALKIGYLTNKLNLSADEAQKFWPIYNQYESEIKNARQEKRQNSASELDAEDKILKIRKKYNAEFSKAIGSDKANDFFRYEKDFWNDVKKVLQERRQMRQDRFRGN